jgi:hypothetical protein
MPEEYRVDDLGVSESLDVQFDPTELKKGA